MFYGNYNVVVNCFHCHFNDLEDVSNTTSLLFYLCLATTQTS